MRVARNVKPSSSLHVTYLERGKVGAWEIIKLFCVGGWWLQLADIGSDEKTVCVGGHSLQNSDISG